MSAPGRKRPALLAVASSSYRDPSHPAGNGQDRKRTMASNNKSVILTGAASGIGLAMTMGLLAAGHNVTAVDRAAAGLKDLAARAGGLPGSVTTVTADLAQQDSFGLITATALVK